MIIVFVGTVKLGTIEFFIGRAVLVLPLDFIRESASILVSMLSSLVFI